MVRRLILSLGLLMAGIFGTQPDRAQGQEPPPPLPALVEEILLPALAEHHIPGAVVAVVQDGRVVLSQGYGKARLDPEMPMRGDTVVRAGSVSKVLTALGAAALADAGRLDLNRPVSGILPWVSAHPTGGPFTTWDLVAHTAGFDDTIVGLHTYDRNAWVPLETYLRRNLRAPVHPAGRHVSYSSWNTALVGAVIEAVTGQEFAAYMDDAVFAPLGMTRTTFRVVDRPAAVAENEAVGYRYTGQGHVAYPYNHVLLAPGIALQTTADDMARLLLFLTGGLNAPGVISPAGLAEFQRTQFVQYPGVRGRAFGPSEAFLNGHRVLFHDGNGIGFSSRLLWIPELRFGLFVSVNAALLDPGQTISPASRVPMRFSEALVERLFPAGTASPARDGVRRLAQPLAASVLDDPSAVEGYYRPTDHSRTTVQKLGYLFDTFTVSVADGKVVIGSRPFEETEPGLLAAEGGRSAFLIPAGPDMDARLLISNSSYERIPTLETPPVLAAALGSAVLAGIVGLVGWIVVARRCRSARGGALAAAAGAGLPLAAMAMVGAGIVLMDPQDLFFGALGIVGAGWVPLALALPACLAGWRVLFAGPAAASRVLTAVSAAAGTSGLLLVIGLFWVFRLI